MCEWNKVKFLNLFSEPTKNGIYKSKEFHGRGAKIINMGEVFAYSFIGNQEMNRVEINDKERNSFIVKNGDLLFARRSLVESGAGKCAIANGITEETTFESSIIRVRLNENNAIPLFYMYWMRSLSGRTAINGIVNGVNVKGIRATDLQNIEVDLPPLHTQQRIATILSRYDSLIENYQKQIKLLEESAQRLYKEWFIDLRFPGHENTKIVDGVPEGWEKEKLRTLVEFKRGKTITKKEVVEGSIPVVAGGLEPAYYCNKFNTSERVITISGSGANAGYTRMYFEKVWASDCSFADSSMTPYLHFVFCFLRDNKTTIDNMQKGAAQPHVYAKDINLMDIYIPTEIMLKSFEERVSKYFDTISSLQSQIRHLTEARDRLLPKLMSGEIEV